APRASGALERLVAVQLSVLGLYLAPVLRGMVNWKLSDMKVLEPPHTIISFPVHIALCPPRAEAPIVLVAVQLLVAGLYLPPVFKVGSLNWPPQTIISLPVQMAV